MKISLNWLSELVDIHKLDPEHLADQISEHCFEVEEVIRGNAAVPAFSDVYAARVLEWQKHPNADRLRVVKLDIGGRTVEPVVCGANNFDSGDIVALALPGANIPRSSHDSNAPSFVLGKATIRGVESQGMICSEFELGFRELPEEKPEILILPGDIKPGTNLKEYFSEKSANKKKSNSVVLDLALPANRPDLHSHVGVARELWSILGYKGTSALAKVASVEIKDLGKAGKLKVDIKEKKACPYYLGMRIKVSVGESPEEIKEKLSELGLRSVNNVVDITNYIMHELGEPLHAFDAKFVDGGIVVRYAKSGEKLMTLDHKERELTSETLVIADKEKALAVAGIMGGKQSEVSNETTEIILEAANFEPTSIRRTSKALGIQTTGSILWEKGLHPHQAVLGAVRALELLQKYAAAELVEIAEEGSAKRADRSIEFRADEINSLLGTDWSEKDIAERLNKAGFETTGKEKLSARIPYYRTDMINYADIADELIRIVGLNIVAKKPLSVVRNAPGRNISNEIYSLKQKMVELGFNEVQNYSFVSEKEIAEHGLASAQHIKVKNPLSSEQGYLRNDLAISINKCVQTNLKYRDAFQIFEVGTAYHGFLNEKTLLSFAIYDSGLSPEALIAKAKGVLEQISTEVKSEIKINPEPRYAHATFEVEGVLGKPKQFKSYSKYPQRVFDISLVVSEAVNWGEIWEIIEGHKGDILQGTEIFEAAHLYPSGKVPKFHKELAEKGLKNMAFHVIFQASDRTLKDSEIMPIYDKIIEEMKTKLKAEIR